MKRIILAVTVVLIFTQPAFAYTRLFYRFTVRSNYEKVEFATDPPVPTNSPAPTDTPLPDPSTIPPAEEGVSDEDGLAEEPVEEIVSGMIGPFDDVELIEPSAQPSTPPVEEDLVDEGEVEQNLADEAIEELGVENTPEEKREGQEIVVKSRVWARIEKRLRSQPQKK